MFFKKKGKEANLKQAESLEKKGDQFLLKNNYEKAIKAYREASKLNPENGSVYQKLIDAQASLGGEWSENDFIEVMDWTMKKQEIENPQIKNLHETLTPTYQKVKQLIGQLLTSPVDSREEILQQIKSFGAQAVLPLLDTLIAIDEMARQSLQPSETSSDSNLTSYDDVEKE